MESLPMTGPGISKQEDPCEWRTQQWNLQPDLQELPAPAWNVTGECAGVQFSKVLTVMQKISELCSLEPLKKFTQKKNMVRYEF